MTTARQLHHIATRPKAFMDFVTTGRLPRTTGPTSPLIDLLLRLSPRDRIAITRLTVGPALGYTGSRQFRSAEAALRWMRPDAEMIEGQSWPAESSRDKRFNKNLTLDELLAHASHFPERLQTLHSNKALIQGKS